MINLPLNEHGVPLYPKGHAGRLLVTLAAIDALDKPTASSVAALTGLSKGNIDTYVAALIEQMDVRIVKDGPIYRIECWGSILKQAGVKKTLHGSV